jgi:nucleoside-diphosphate-sugar epimerase
MARYLVTGGSGFVGAEIVAALVGRGDDVVVFDLRSSPRIDGLMAEYDKVSFVAGEIVEWPGVASVMQAFKPDAVVHCAAIVGVAASLNMPMQTMRVNVEGSLNVLEAMRLFGVRRMVHMSSEETYGHFQSDIVTEDHPQNPLMAYGISKVAVEQFGRTYAQRFGLEVLNVRACWVYGPGLPRLRIPNTLIQAAVSGQSLHLPGGADFAVDHTYVDDLVDGTIRVLDYADHPYDAYHIASGAAASLTEIVGIIKDLAPGADISVRPGPLEFTPGLPVWRKGALDLSRARDVLGYRPRYDMRGGIEATYNALRKRS